MRASNAGGCHSAFNVQVPSLVLMVTVAAAVSRIAERLGALVVVGGEEDVQPRLAHE
ncbi:hypothetical protein LFM09_17240 [Lentzea alba]|uniref:hypothetical protein n=1 Tax=Lentzea alba TaxID=2714351 RepID=UPI0039BFD83F